MWLVSLVVAGRSVTSAAAVVSQFWVELVFVVPEPFNMYVLKIPKPIYKEFASMSEW